MKRFGMIFTVMAGLILMAVPAAADVDENFDAFYQSGYGNYDYNGFHIENGLCASAYGSGCSPLPTNAVRLRNAASYLEYVGIDGNGKDGGVGDITFDYQSWDGSPPSEFTVTVSVDGGAYTWIGDIFSDACTGYSQFTHTMNDASDNIKIKIEWVTGERLHIDNFVITDYGTGPENETDAHLGGCVGGLATISSLVDTQPEEQFVLHFETWDAGDGGQALNTIILNVAIGQGDANAVSDWTDVIAGATLYELVSAQSWVGTVNSNNIVFSGTPMLIMPDAGPVYEWELYIWLRTDLPYWADNEILEFHVDPTSFVTDPTGAGFDPLDPACESGDLSNMIDIVATQLSITTQPYYTPICVDQDFRMRAGFTDVNGGIDEDFNEDITISLNTGTGNLTTVTGYTVTSSYGQSYWSDLRYDVAETGVVIQAVSPTYPTPVLTDPFDVEACPTIVIDAYPTCWDGNATDEAVPFAVHITISDWTDGADQDAYLKVYDGSNNPYHYTEANGWKNTYYWTDKPIIHIDANGNWAGTLALKSSGYSTFQPRVGLVSNTNTRLTGTLIPNATLLDLTTTGVIVEDRDGITSYADPGNVILARNEADEIIGSWIIEDNGYPLDDGGSPIASGGWRMAICDVCEDVTFESCDPDWWVESFFDVVYDFCPTPGSTVEMDDVQLPVELTSFTALAGDASVTLNWTTATESENDHFEIERSGELVASVEAVNSASGSEYEWIDNEVVNGTTYEYTLIAVDVNGARDVLRTVEATPGFNNAVITEYALHQNYPNPFNPSTNFVFDLLESGFVTLKVYNLLGQDIATVVNADLNAGRHIVSFDAGNLSSGVYLYRIEVNNFTAQNKMMLMK